MPQICNTMLRYSPIDDPVADYAQQTYWRTNGARFGADYGPRRSAPAEPPFNVQEHGRWKQGDRTLRNFKPRMYLVRPVDGKRRGTEGRIVDAITNEGPDVFVMKCGDRRTFMKDRPQRWQWSGWPLTAKEKDRRRLEDMDFRRKDLVPVRDWRAKNARERTVQKLYDFHDRKYRTQDHMNRQPARQRLTDARWTPGAKRSDQYPLSFRDGNRRWWTRVPPNAGSWPGGRPRNPRPPAPPSTI